MKKILFITTLLLLAYQTTIAQNKKVAHLAYNMKEGDKYEAVVTSNQLVSFLGQELPQKLTMVLAFDVLKVDATTGITTNKLTYKRVALKQEMPNRQGIDYDSDVPLSEDASDISKTLAKSFGALIGKTLIMKLKKNGEIVETSSEDPSLQKVIQEQGNTFAVFPTKPVRIGKSWKTEEKRISNGFEMYIITKNTLKGYKDGKWVIAMESTIKDGKGKIIGSQKGTASYKEADIMEADVNTLQDMKELEVNKMKMSIVSTNSFIVTKK